MTGRYFLNHLPCVLLRLITPTATCIGLVFSFVALSSPIHASTVITETTGAGSLGTQVLPPSGDVYGITGGQTIGTNLYHSFAQFNVGTGDIAQFQTPTLIQDPAMQNILGRITDQKPSAIFGAIDSATYYPSANLFLMNPHGFLFGPNATVNVGGMVAFTTADYLRLTDNVSFEAIPGWQDALLSTFPVAAFGFLGLNPAAIAVQGSQLTVANGTGISLVGGDQGFDATNPDTGESLSVPDGVTMTEGKLLAPSGQINLVSAASTGEISVGDFMPPSDMAMGGITLTQGAIISTSGDDGGTVRIRSGQFILDGSALVAHTTGPSYGMPTAISVIATDTALINNHSALFAWSTGAGRGGDIEVMARAIDVAGGSFVYTQSTDSGPAGAIRMTASDSISVRGAEFGNPSKIFSESSTASSASTGSITIQAPLITLSDMGAILTGMLGSGEGTKAGDITIDTARLNLLSGGLIQTSSGSDVAPSGNISVTAEEAVTLVGIGSDILNDNVNGGTGYISIRTGRLSLSDQARINSQTWFDTDPAAANTPKILIAADSSIALSTGSRIDVGGFLSDTVRLELATQNLTMSGASTMTTLSNANGAAGTIVLNIQDLSMSEGSQIVSSSTQGAGHGGDIIVNATGSIVVSGLGTDPAGTQLVSGIFSNTMAGFEDPSFTGNAGNISITGQSIEVSNGARIDSSSQFFALGNAGNINLMAPTITISGGKISTSTEFSGQAGTITLHADTVTLNNGGKLTSSSILRQIPLFDGEVIPSPTGNAGNIQIDAGNQFTMTNSSVTTEATESGGGAIKITTNPSGTVHLTDSTISASVLNGAGGGGSVNIDPQFVILLNSQILANAVFGPGGTISITTNLLLQDGNSVISASSQFGVNGTITIQSPNAPISGQIHPLGKTPLLATTLLTQRCAALAGGQFSSFTVAGRDTLPTEPGSWLTSPVYAAGVREGQGAQGESVSGLSGVSRASNQINHLDQTNQTNQPHSARLSLRQIAPAGFLTQAFAVDRSAGCSS